MSDTVITVNLAPANRSANYWILDTGATDHITGNRHLFKIFHSMAKGEHQVKTTNNSFVDAEGSRSIMFYLDSPNSKPAKIVLQHVLYVPACGTNNLVRIIQLMREGVNFEFKLDAATANLGSVLVYEAPLINSMFVLKATAASVSTSSVVIDDPTSSTPSCAPEISEADSNIRPAVDDQDILV
jgi:hypothetical protein